MDVAVLSVHALCQPPISGCVIFPALFHGVSSALQTSLPPQPIFDVRYNLINSTFPLQLLPLLSQLCYDWNSDDECGFPLDIRLQPQKPPASSLSCPLPNTAFPPAFYLDELQQKYDMTCMVR